MELDVCKFKCRFKQILIYIVFSIIFLTIGGIKPTVVSAEDNSSAAFVVRVNTGGNMVPIKSYSIGELESLNQVKQVYSSIDYMPAPNIILAKGVLVRDLLAQANINLQDVQELKLYSSDGWSHSYSSSYLFGDQRSYYSNIVTEWDKNTSDPAAFVVDGEKNKSAVEPILALQSYQERYAKEQNWDKLEKNQPISFFFGQTKINEPNYVNFGKLINKMDITLKDSTPLINLNQDAEQNYQPGNSINLTGTVKNVTGVTFHVNDPTGKTIFNSQKLQLNNNTFTSAFKLPENAIEGEYIIVFEAENPQNYITKFNFKVGKGGSGNTNKGKEGKESDTTSTPGLSTGTGIQGVPADTLTIVVGYYGGPYYIKKVYSLNDLKSLPQAAETYTFIDNLPAVVVDSARGVKLTDILADAGIDVNSTEEFHFYCSDVKVGWYQSIQKSYLVDTKRYYYPNLPKNWDRQAESSLPGSADGAVPVDTVIAYEDNWKRFATSPDFTDMQTDTRFRLVFGQTDTTTHNASKSAKWIHEIDVMLGGKAPSKATDQNIVNLKIGSTFNLSADVSGAKGTDKTVKWSSSNTNVAKVDNDGKVTIVGKGTANITATTVSGSKTDVYVVGASGNNGNEASVGAQVKKNSNGNEVLASTQAKKNNNEENKKNDNKETAEKKQSTDTGSDHLTDKNTKANSTKNSEIQQDAGNQPWRVYEMSKDASPLQMQGEDNRSSRICVAVIVVLLLLLGSMKKYLEYVREVVK